MLRTITFFILFLLITCAGLAQDSTGSLAFKKNKPQLKRGGFFYHPDPAYQILQQFNLMREANAGDPLAQHELGLRYLFGEGIPPDHQVRIFERFYRVDKSRSREKGGTGLGLAIVKHILDGHNAKAEVESTPGKGSTFSFRLPRVRPESSESPEAIKTEKH